MLNMLKYGSLATPSHTIHRRQRDVANSSDINERFMKHKDRGSLMQMMAEMSLVEINELVR